MLVKDFKENEGYKFSEDFLRLLPEYCSDPRCGAPTEMSETLTALRCSNPRCPSKVAIRIVAMMNKLGVKDFGGKGKRVDDFISKFGIDNPLMIFAYEPDTDGSLGDNISLDVSKRIYEQINSKRSFTLAEYVRIANLPFIQTSAFSIFGDYDDLASAYKDIEEGGVEFIRNKLNIKKGACVSSADSDDIVDREDSIEDVSVRAIRVYQSLMSFKTDLEFGLDYVTILKTHTDGMKMLKVKCTEEVGHPYKTKADFYATVNNLYPDLHVEFVDTATKDLDYLVWAGADESGVRVSRKVEKVRAWNEQYEDKKTSNTLTAKDKYIPIVSAAQFLGVLQSLEKEMHPEN